MGVKKVNARDWRLYYNGQLLNPECITNIGYSRSKNDTDTTVYKSGGFSEHMTMSRGASLTVEGFYLEDSVTGAQDPTQSAIDALCTKVGSESLGKFKLLSPGGREFHFRASANPTGGIGGGNDDKTPWGVELTVSGKVRVQRQIEIDFSENETGTGVPDGWTPVWNTEGQTWEIVEDAEAVGGKYLRHTATDYNGALRFDAAGTVTDGCIVAKLRTSGTGMQNGVVLRGGYFAQLSYNAPLETWYLEMYARTPDTGTPTEYLGQYEIPGSGTPDWFWIRLECVGTTIRARVWDDGVAEHDTWDIDVEDDTYTSGFAGIGADVDSGQRDFDVVKIAKYYR